MNEAYRSELNLKVLRPSDVSENSDNSNNSYNASNAHTYFAEGPTNQNYDIIVFWNMDKKGKWSIHLPSFKSFLESRGYYLIEKQSGECCCVFIKNNIIEGEVSPNQIYETCEQYLEQLTNDEEKEGVKNALLSNRSLFKDDFLSLLKSKEVNPLRDDEHHSYIPVKNGVVEVSKDNIQLRNYSDFPDNHFWRKQIIDFDFVAKDKAEIIDQSEFFKFLEDITHIKGHPEESKKRLEGLMTILGYLLHTYKDPSKAKAIILMDADHFKNTNGGTGKGIITQALGRIRSVSQEDGKSINTGNRFNWSQVFEHTQIIALDDIPEHFNFKSLFSMITDGITVERKYENKFNIPFDRSPKLILTSNYEVNGGGSSYKRRKVEFELSNYYDENFGPEDKYGHLFFLQWDNQQWQFFYNVMMQCVQEYLEKGIVETNSIALWYPKLKSATCEEFADFADENFSLNVKYNKKKMFQAFKEAYKDFKNMEQRTFTSWIQQYAKVRGYKLRPSHSDTERYFELNLDEESHTQ